MKILQVYKTYLPETFAGVARVIWEIANSGPAHGDEHRVLALSSHPSRPVDLGSHRVFQAQQQLFLASSGFSASAVGLYRELWDWCDVVHFHFPWPMMDLLHLSEPRRALKPAVATYHSDIVRQKLFGRLYAPLGDWFLSHVDAIVATSPNYLETSPVLGRFRSKTRPIPIGLAERPTPSPALVAKWRDRFPEPFFLFVGAGRYYKGLSYLMKAAAATGLPVVLAGAISPADLGHRPPANAALVGEVDDADKEALLDLCLALVLPSHLRSEAYGVVLVEASRAGRPMITCEIGTGTSYVNRHGATGLVVPPANPPALGNAMRDLWSDRARAAMLGSGARRGFEERLTAERMTTSYAELYRSFRRPG
jgi:glycosyltransferase involved in cell wall biosynthesis